MLLREKHLCLVDDDNDEYALFLNAIQKVDSSVKLTFFSSCRDFFRFLELADNLPSIIVIDIYMPGNDGLACLNKIKTSERSANIPVYVYSGVFSEKAKKDALQLGAVDYFTKPFSMEGMKQMVEKILDPSPRPGS